MSEIKLLPCPFCGGKAIKSAFSWGGISDESTIQCTICGASTKVLKTEEAIEHWNTRKPMERIVERLEELENITLDQYNNSMAGTYEHDFADGKECGVSMALDIVRNGGKE